MDTPRWDACTMDPHWLMRQVECHPGFASYVQAAFTLLALAIAILVPWLTDRHARKLAQRQRSLTSKAFAMLNSAEAFQLSMRVRAVKEQIAFVRRGIGRTNDWAEALEIELPAGLSAAAMMLHEMDFKTVESLRHVVMAVASYKGALGQLKIFRAEVPEDWTKACDQLEVMRSLIERSCDVVLVQYDRLVDEMKLIYP